MPKLVFENVSRQLVIVPLPGTSVQLAPGEKTRPLEEFEQENNAVLAKLVARGALARAAPAAKAAPSARAAPAPEPAHHKT